ncbi:MAG: methylase [Verrucomicrobiaceae bacterium]|nr:methylase [Verrucomicrobiaceae bacterium]
MTEKPFSQACENNKRPLLGVLAPAFREVDSVLEIGSGTGQHAVFFAAHMPWLRWQPSDRAENLRGIRAWCADAALPNLDVPLELDASWPQWPVAEVAGVFSANTAHIMSWAQVELFVAGVGRTLRDNGVFCLYGPFNYGGAYTSASNAHFNSWLQQRDALSGIRDFEAVDALARSAGLVLQADHAMPANNRTLVWHKMAQPVPS